VETTADDVMQKFCTSRRAETVYRAWREDPRRRQVVPVVMAHRVRTVYALGAGDVTEVCKRTEHALGDVRRADGEAVRAIVNWHPDFAFTHMFHFCMEKSERVPTYQEFRQFTQTDPLGQEMLGSPSRAAVAEAVRRGENAARARAAMRWRVGNAYYSFLREIYTAVELRERGVDLRMHPLADALFRVDGWVGSTALSLRIGNAEFRKGENQGRKTPAEKMLADNLPPLKFDAVELRPATEFGRVHLPTAQHLDRAAESLLSTSREQ
jgi:hypothetical protein